MLFLPTLTHLLTRANIFFVILTGSRQIINLLELFKTVTNLKHLPHEKRCEAFNITKLDNPKLPNLLFIYVYIYITLN